MRALLVCAAPVAGTPALVARLATEADLIVAVDGGGSACLEAGVSPDVVLGDFDSLSQADLDRLRELGAEILRYPAEKDASDLELAIAEVRRRGATSLVLTAASSGRLDHTLAVLGALQSSADLEARLVDPEIEVWALSPGARSSLALSGPDTTFSVFAFGEEAVVSVEGAVWELDEAVLPPTTSVGLSNRVGPSGQALISVSTGSVLVFAPQVAGGIRAQGT